MLDIYEMRDYSWFGAIWTSYYFDEIWYQCI